MWYLLEAHLLGKDRLRLCPCGSGLQCAKASPGEERPPVSLCPLDLLHMGDGHQAVKAAPGKSLCREGASFSRGMGQRSATCLAKSCSKLLLEPGGDTGSGRPGMVSMRLGGREFWVSYRLKSSQMTLIPLAGGHGNRPAGGAGGRQCRLRRCTPVHQCWLNTGRPEEQHQPLMPVSAS